MEQTDWLAAIVAAPDDDYVRLVYADWLEENAQVDHAELIRVQIELAHTSPGSDRYGELQTRERQLLAHHSQSWCTDFDVARRFRRGALESIRCDGPDHFLSVADRVFARHPIEEVWLSPFKGGWDPDTVAALAACPHLTRVRRLHLPWMGECHDRTRSQMTREALFALTASPHLAGLRLLNLGESGEGEPAPDDTWFAELIGQARRPQPPWVRGLQTLAVGCTSLSDGTLELLPRSPLADSLTALDVAMLNITAPAFETFVQSPLWRRLTDLEAIYLGARIAERAPIHSALVNALADSGLRRLSADLPGEALAAVSSWGRLEALRIDTTDGTEGALALATSKHLQQLRRLDYLPPTSVNVEVLQKLAANPCTSRVEHLEFDSLGGFDMVEEGLVALVESPHLTSLRVLSATFSRISTAALRRFLAAPLAHRLRALHLKHARIDEEGVRLLAETASMPQLTTLEVGLVAKPSMDALQALLMSPHLPRLSHLTLVVHAEGGLTAAGERLLLTTRKIAWPGLSLSELEYRQRWQVPPPGVQELSMLYRQRFGNFDGPKHLDSYELFFPIFDEFP